MSRPFSNSPSSLSLPQPFSEGEEISAQLVAAYSQQSNSIWPSYTGSRAPSPQPPQPTRYSQRRPRRSAPISEDSSFGQHASRLSWCSVQSEPGASTSAHNPSVLNRRPVNGMASAPSQCTPLPPGGLFASTSAVPDRYVPPLRANEVINSRRSRNATYWLNGPPVDQDSAAEYLNDPSENPPEQMTPRDHLDGEQYERAQANFRDNPWASFGQGLYTPPENIADIDPDESFSRICALLEERDRKNPPNPAALHLLLNPDAETPLCTYVDLNSAEYNVHLNPTHMYDDRDFMLPATATHDTVVKIIIDWPFHPVVSPLPGTVQPAYDIEVRHDDDRFGDHVVSVDDVWNAVYSCLRRPVERRQYYEYDAHAREQIRKAFERRCKRWPGNSRDMGLAQVDLLGGKNRFIGLIYKEIDGEVFWQARFKRGKP